MILSGQEQDFKFLYVVRSKISGLDPSTKTRAPKLQNQERLKYSPEGYKWVPLIFKYEIEKRSKKSESSESIVK